MDLMSVLLMLALAGTATVGFFYWEERGNRRTLEEKYRLAKERNSELASEIEETKQQKTEEATQLRALLEEVRQERHEEAQAYLERSTRYEERISELIRQTQNMAERIASLRKGGLSEGGEDFHVEEPEPEKPWSDGLRSFYEAVESVEAQQSVEDYIVERRDAGVEDEQILRELREGTYGGGS